MKLPLLGGSGEDRSSDVSQQLTQNLYVHKTQTGKSKTVLYSTPAITLFTEVGLGPIRGAIEYNDIYFVVSNNELYEVNSVGTGVLRGTLNSSLGHVSMAHNGPDNGQQIAIADGTDFYIWDSSASDFKIITDSGDPDYDADCPTPTQVLFFDGLFVVNNPAVTGTFNVSGSYDGTAWDATEFATAERDPDSLKALTVSNRKLILAGRDTAEIWFNSGALDFPYEPMQSGFSEWGIAAPFSLVEVSGITFWLSNNKEGNGMIIMMTGGNPQVISTPEIATEISKISDISDCYSYSYQYQQHAFVVFTFVSGKKTLVYDILTQEWHTWKTESTGYHRSTGHTFVFNKHLVGDPINGNIYKLDWDSNTDNGESIKRIRRSQNIHGDDRPIKHHGVWIDIQEGVGDATTPNPQILLRWRDDNGSWSNYHARSMGKIGEKNKKCIWRALGRSSDRVYEISVTDPVSLVIVDGYANVEGDERTKE